MPEWPDAYVGIPWAWRGRDRAGIDCYGLVRLVYAERLGVALPVEQYLRPVTAARRIREAVEGPCWREAEAPRGMDVAICDSLLYAGGGLRRGPWHLALRVDGEWALHAVREVGSCLVRHRDLTVLMWCRHG